jgi:hypothetical protein
MPTIVSRRACARVSAGFAVWRLNRSTVSDIAEVVSTAQWLTSKDRAPA